MPAGAGNRIRSQERAEGRVDASSRDEPEHARRRAMAVRSQIPDSAGFEGELSKMDMGSFLLRIYRSPAVRRKERMFLYQNSCLPLGCRILRLDSCRAAVSSPQSGAIVRTAKPGRERWQPALPLASALSSW